MSRKRHQTFSRGHTLTGVAALSRVETSVPDRNIITIQQNMGTVFGKSTILFLLFRLGSCISSCNGSGIERTQTTADFHSSLLPLMNTETFNAARRHHLLAAAVPRLPRALLRASWIHR